ncbi:MAG TPA: glycosyltransferase [Candidatus Nanoarchaeia archaeon]|nr:glycosyltransferase [Candidatus Nanoarchaeia archaeon]
MDISVVIPVHRGREKDLELLLSSLDRAQENLVDSQSEVVVVDDGCESLEGLRSRYKDVCVILNHGKGPSAARNWGVEHARYEVVAFTDSDCVVDPFWLRNISSHFNTNPENVAVQGPPWNFMGQRYTTVSKYEAGFYEAVFRLRHVVGNRAKNVDTRNFAAKRKVIRPIASLFGDLKIAGGDDRVCGLKLREKGRIGWDESLLVYHKDLCFRDQMRSHRRHGQGRAYWDYAPDLMGVNRRETYLEGPRRLGVPAWYAMAANLSFLWGQCTEMVKVYLKK